MTETPQDRVNYMAVDWKTGTVEPGTRQLAFRRMERIPLANGNKAAPRSLFGDQFTYEPPLRWGPERPATTPRQVSTPFARGLDVLIDKARWHTRDLIPKSARVHQDLNPDIGRTPLVLIEGAGAHARVRQLPDELALSHHATNRWSITSGPRLYALDGKHALMVQIVYPYPRVGEGVMRFGLIDPTSVPAVTWLGYVELPPEFTRHFRVPALKVFARQGGWLVGLQSYRTEGALKASSRLDAWTFVPYPPDWPYAFESALPLGRTAQNLLPWSG